MKESYQIIELTKIINQVQKIDDEIDRILDGYKDYTETFSDLIGPVKSIISIFNFAKKMKFKKFIKGFAMAINKNQIDDSYFVKLERYLNNEKNVSFIAETIDSAIEAKSQKSAVILGFYAGIILNLSKNLEYKDMVLINALRIMFDNDIDIFLCIYDRFKDRAFEGEIRVHDTKQEFIQIPYEILEMENTIEKLKGVQAFSYDVGGMGNVGNAWGAFKFNDVTTYIYDAIKSILRERIE